MSARRLSASGVRRLVGIGQRWARRRDGIVIVVYQVHRGDRTVEVHFEDEEPCAPRTRFPLGFGELGTKYRLLDDTKEAA